MKIVSPKEARALIESTDNLQVVEALPEKYYREGHLPGAISVSHDASEDVLLSKLNKDFPVLVYCASGPCKNSSLLSKRLVELGYSETYDFDEGKEGWTKAGYELVRGDK